MAVNFAAEHSGHGQLSGLINVLHDFHGKWVIAGLAVLVALGMCSSAIRRMHSEPKPPEFLPGVVVLESLRWFRHGPPKSRRSA